ncbi:hypothetical protein [Pedobacter sp. UBA4863]|uniref:hypothetical protein n=1 Tax=Pedobacter sp. UBA4863 TaxID=1947060 RepID=UPI0025D0BD46|nr:hypothetical protein [Pedobacter sp. UBA4863]
MTDTALFKTIFIAISIFSMHTTLLAQKSKSTKNDIVLSELNFGQLAIKTHIKHAFEQNLDTTGMIVSGIEIVNGLKAYSTLKPDSTQRLIWYPTYAYINATHDFGFTSGPYLYYAKATEKPDATGNYFSIWRKDQNGIFKLIFDGGVNHSKIRNDYNIAINNGSTQVSKVKAAAKEIISIPPSLQKTDETINFLNNKVMILRTDKPILWGKSQYQPLSTNMIYTQKGSGYDKNGTLFYCFGNLAINATAALQRKFHGYYVQVWHFNKKWEIIADLVQLTK